MPAALCCGACCNLPCMLCYICHTVSCHAELCYAMLCYASCAFRVMLACCAMPCYACCALLCAMPCCTACCAVLCILYSAHAMPYHAIRHDAMPATSFKNPLVVNASSPPLETSHSIPAHKVMHTHTHTGCKGTPPIQLQVSFNPTHKGRAHTHRMPRQAPFQQSPSCKPCWTSTSIGCQSTGPL